MMSGVCVFLTKPHLNNVFVFCFVKKHQNRIICCPSIKAISRGSGNEFCVCENLRFKKISSGLYSICVIRSNIFGENESPEDKLN